MIQKYGRAARLLLLIMTIFVAAACAPDATPEPTATIVAQSEATPTPSDTPSPTETPLPPAETPSPSPTDTTGPTDTPVPTETPLPDPTDTPAPTETPSSEASADVGSAGIGDSFYPQQGNGGYDVQHYLLDVTVDVDENTINGLATITALALQDLSAFNLDFGGPEISAVEINDQPAEFSRDDGELTLTPAQTLPQDEIFSVSISYSGEPGAGITERRRGFSSGWSNYGSGVLVAGQPSSAVGWFPVNEHPRDKASYTFQITVPKPFVVAANGHLIETVDNGNSATYVWEAEAPMASYLTTVNIADFEVQTEQGPDEVLIRNYFAANLSDEVRSEFSEQDEMIDYFSGLFGPFPFDVYGSVVHDIDLGFALETQTLSVFGRNASSRVVVHELAHQWFGDSVSLTNWQDIWLNEGFATYAEWLWMERESGPDALRTGVNRAYSAVAPGQLVQRLSREDVFAGLDSLELDDTALSRAQVEAALLAIFAGTLPEDETNRLLDNLPAGGLPGSAFSDTIATLTFDEVQLTVGRLNDLFEALGLERNTNSGSNGTIVPPGRPDVDQLFNIGVYQRGGLTLHALRLTVGDETFFEILRTYTDRFRDGNVETADFIAVAEEVSNQSLDDFFDAWLYGTDVPDLPELDLFRADFALPEGS